MSDDYRQAFEFGGFHRHTKSKKGYNSLTGQRGPRLYIIGVLKEIKLETFLLLKEKREKKKG